MLYEALSRPIGSCICKGGIQRIHTYVMHSFENPLPLSTSHFHSGFSWVIFLSCHVSRILSWAASSLFQIFFTRPGSGGVVSRYFCRPRNVCRYSHHVRRSYGFFSLAVLVILARGFPASLWFRFFARCACAFCVLVFLAVVPCVSCRPCVSCCRPSLLGRRGRSTP